MEIATLGLVLDVTNAGSFAAVARERGIDASSVSRAVSTLEAELGARLFHRSTRSLALTDVGARFLARVEPALADLHAAREELAEAGEGAVGTVRITASVAFGERLLAPLLPAMRDRLPRVQIELPLTDANVDVVADRVDVAIRLAPSYRADVIGVRLFPTRYRVVAAPGWVADHGMPATPDALREHRCLLFALPDYRTRWLFRRDGAAVEVPVAGDLVISTALTLHRAAVMGLGPALLADWMVAEDLKTGRLVALLPEFEATATTFDTAAWLLYPSRRHQPVAVRLVIDFLRERLASPAMS